MKLRAACVVVGFLSLALSPVPLTVAQTPAETASALPHLIRFGGSVKDLNGNPLTGVVGITFALYSEPTGGAALWLETQNITADSTGHYVALLGSTKPDGLPTDVFTSGEARWVGVQVSGQAEQPRVLLVSAPYALKAGDAETLGGLPPSAFVLANRTQGSATRSPRAAPAAAAQKNSVPPANPAVTGKGVVDYIPMWDTTSDIVDSIIYQKSSEIGINTTAPAALLDVNGKTDIRDTLTLYPSSTDNTLAVNGTSFKVSSVGAVTFITGQTFPGTGTITGITTSSGSGLSGGGTTGTLSLKVPSAGITNAMLANSKITLNASTAGGLTVPGPMTLGNTYTIGLATGGVTNAMLQNSKITLNASTAGGLTVPGAMSLGSTYTIGLKTCSGTQVLEYVGTAWTCTTPTLTVSAGTDLTGGGLVSLGGTVTLNLDTTKVPLLASANTFTADQTVDGNLTATGDVAGSTVSGLAVIGVTSVPGVSAVTGSNNVTSGESNGVYGSTASSAGAGVFGLNSASEGPGVYGQSDHGVGVYAQYSTTSLTGSSSAGKVGVWGDGGGQDTGVQGTSDEGNGAYFANNSASATPTLNVWAFAAGGDIAYFFNASTTDSCVIDANGLITCSGPMAAVVSTDSGGRRVSLYAVQSPENWFEDFGSGTLSNGAATIRLDPAFAQTVNTGTGYHVFLTPNGDCKGLYVAGKTASGFEVRELGGGVSSASFDYRIVAKRSGYENVRLTDVTEKYKRLEEQRQQRHNRARQPSMRRPAAPQHAPSAARQIPARAAPVVPPAAVVKPVVAPKAAAAQK
jgi:hypothetical protein